MRINCRVIAIMLFVFLGRAYADAPLPSQKEYEPPNGKGRVVVVVSGQTGPGNYAYVAKDFAEQGYYAVLVDGNDFWIRVAWRDKGWRWRGSLKGCHYSRTTVAARFARQGGGGRLFARRGLYPNLCNTNAGIGFRGRGLLSSDPTTLRIQTTLSQKLRCQR